MVFDLAKDQAAPAMYILAKAKCYRAHLNEGSENRDHGGGPGDPTAASMAQNPKSLLKPENACDDIVVMPCPFPSGQMEDHRKEASEADEACGEHHLTPRPPWKQRIRAVVRNLEHRMKSDRGTNAAMQKNKITVRVVNCRASAGFQPIPVAVSASGAPPVWIEMVRSGSEMISKSLDRSIGTNAAQFYRSPPLIFARFAHH